MHPLCLADPGKNLKGSGDKGRRMTWNLMLEHPAGKIRQVPWIGSFDDWLDWHAVGFADSPYLKTPIGPVTRYMLIAFEHGVDRRPTELIDVHWCPQQRSDVEGVKVKGLGDTKGGLDANRAWAVLTGTTAYVRASPSIASLCCDTTSIFTTRSADYKNDQASIRGDASVPSPKNGYFVLDARNALLDFINTLVNCTLSIPTTPLFMVARPCLAIGRSRGWPNIVNTTAFVNPTAARTPPTSLSPHSRKQDSPSRLDLANVRYLSQMIRVHQKRGSHYAYGPRMKMDAINLLPHMLVVLPVRSAPGPLTTWLIISMLLGTPADGPPTSD
ncbi:hypothetical protein BD779DRAFT_1466046 [Infundibulicybe gibba]|nr:hypothetical protein BD779DRAFT_1466046 [Infundibulicybe gibba]